MKQETPGVSYYR